MNNIVYLHNLREEKENQLVSFVSKHISATHMYVERQVNIREKVKAKHIFSEQISLEKGVVFSSLQEKLFNDWFTYDYVTISGMTIYQNYIKNANGQKHPLDSVVHALFMASVLEPFKVIKTVGENIHAKKLLTGEECVIKTDRKVEEVAPSSILFLRSIPLLDGQLCVSNIFIQQDDTLIDALLTEYKKSSESWRTFLKKYSIKYSWTSQSVK
ncbi:hypothetical protein [Metabacillus litoralis]|uniref:hypothetical protein n=1 Tax=Metabacillus litoralis TaxID=152268 RepID=UPI000EF61A88|nr:hypothetical protein [Metabacillus litoralis]MCM3162795.1 hypothetical protein [Metabacillus litoralis]MCM3410962.1 hypothetical protein [Metabacillus litoralis]